MLQSADPTTIRPCVDVIARRALGERNARSVSGFGVSRFRRRASKEEIPQARCNGGNVTCVRMQDERSRAAGVRLLSWMSPASPRLVEVRSSSPRSGVHTHHIARTNASARAQGRHRVRRASTRAERASTASEVHSPCPWHFSADAHRRLESRTRGRGSPGGSEPVDDERQAACDEHKRRCAGQWNVHVGIGQHDDGDEYEPPEKLSHVSTVPRHGADVCPQEHKYRQGIHTVH